MKKEGFMKLKHVNHNWKKPSFVVAIILIISIILFYLKNDEKREEILVGEKTEPLCTVSFPDTYSFDDYDARRIVSKENPIDSTFILEINDFSYKTASQIINNGVDNINYSPLSLYYSLALLASGTDGDTNKELMDILGSSDKSRLLTQSKNLYRQIYTDNEIGKLKIANSLWIANSINYKDDFIQSVADNFYATSFSVDFSDEKTGDVMGEWVSENTNNALTPEYFIDSKEILQILNTVYFCDEWTQKFDETKTVQDNFFIKDGSTIKSNFMNAHCSSAEFVKGDGFTRSSLGLKNRGQMVFILPDEGVPIGELLSTPEKIKTIFEDGEENSGEVVWKIPKFNFNSKLEIKDMLNSFGVHSIFDETADFSYITEQIAFLNNICQETHIGIDENGVEAAAFTKMEFAGSAMPKGRADMILNRPFIYGITTLNGTLLFIGICNNPQIE